MRIRARVAFVASVVAAALMMGASADAHTVNIAYRVEANGGVTFFAATYHTGLSTNYGGIIVNGVTYPFTGWVVDLPSDADDQWGWQGSFNESNTWWQTVEVPGLPSGTYSVTTTGTSAVEVPWSYPWSVYIETNEAPVADAGTDREVHCDGLGGAVVALDGSASSDPDGDPLTYSWSVAAGSGIVVDDPIAPVTSAFFPVGVHQVTLTVDDGRGGVDTDDVTITVIDDEAPVASVTTDIASLWSPNKEMELVTISVSASDACWGPDSLLVYCSVSSSQPDDSDGTGTHVGDVGGQDGYSAPVPVTLVHVGGGEYMAEIALRAERDGGDKAGRVYSINVTAVDAANNATNTSTVVVVPHDQRKK